MRATSPLPSFSLERKLEKLKSSEEKFWGKILAWNHQWLTRLESHRLLNRYKALWKRPREAALSRLEPKLDLDSLLLLSLLFHLLFLFLLMQLHFPSSSQAKAGPIRVSLVDPGPTKETAKPSPPTPRKRAVRAKPPVLPKPQPKKIPDPTPKPTPSLPGPKLLAEAPKSKTPIPAEKPVENLIQLPTRQSEPGTLSLATSIDPLPSVTPNTETSLPESLRSGEATPTSKTEGEERLASLSSPDFGPYLEMIKKRVQSVWQYPKGVGGVHQVNLLFVLDSGGKLVRVEVLDSTDSQLNESVLQAMQRASPFPPVPQSLKGLAGWPLRMRFHIDFGVKVSQ